MKNTLREGASARTFNRTVAEHFGVDATVAVWQAFTPGTGWAATPQPGVVTHTQVIGLRRTGASAVALTDGHRIADFQMTELVTAPR